MNGGLAAFAAGMLFAIGLGVAGMTDANRILGFLDLSSSWDPTLAFVMVGAIGVHLPCYALIRRLGRPRLAPSFEVPSAAHVDRRLVAGAAVFGVGWGLGGYCPGPGLVSAASGAVVALVFVVGMSAGMLAYHTWDARWAGRPEADG
jgi:uncharacterized membrane protein YedE/YeeE